MEKTLYMQAEKEKTTDVEIVCDLNADEHQVTVEENGTTTAGTAAIYVKPEGASGYTQVRDISDELLSLNMVEAPHTIKLCGKFSKIKVVVDEDFNGSSFNVIASGW